MVNTGTAGIILGSGTAPDTPGSTPTHIPMRTIVASSPRAAAATVPPASALSPPAPPPPASSTPASAGSRPTPSPLSPLTPLTPVTTSPASHSHNPADTPATTSPLGAVSRRSPPKLAAGVIVDSTAEALVTSRLTPQRALVQVLSSSLPCHATPAAHHHALITLTQRIWPLFFLYASAGDPTNAGHCSLNQFRRFCRDTGVLQQTKRTAQRKKAAAQQGSGGGGGGGGPDEGKAQAKPASPKVRHLTRSAVDLMFASAAKGINNKVRGDRQ